MANLVYNDTEVVEMKASKEQRSKILALIELLDADKADVIIDVIEAMIYPNEQMTEVEKKDFDEAMREYREGKFFTTERTDELFE